MAKRILWLLNHKTLMKAEVPVLFEQGYEVFVPKFFPDDDANLSAEISYQYDSSLTLNKKDLKILNQHNFYSSTIPPRVKKVLERDFDAAICGFFPEMVDALAESFSHTIYIRVFGLAKNESYGRLIKEYCSPKVYERFLKRDHMLLAPSYPNIIYNEPHWLAKNAQFLPLGLPEEIYEHQDTWTGTKDQILFVCPRIKSNPYYGQIYRDFKDQFGDLPHIIVGKQVLPVINDPSVLGFVEQETLNSFFRDCKAMFYHSQEIRHLHYHPLEAMLYGMPVIYMAGSQLDQTAGEHLPGCCKTTAEAYSKLSRILEGDQELIDAVRNSQKRILEKFSHAEILKTWEKNFDPDAQLAKPKIRIIEDEKDINLGVWVHNTYPQSMTGEGINQVLGKTLGGLSNLSNIHIKIACLSWIKPDLLRFLNSFGVDESKLEFILVSEKQPFIYRLYIWYSNRKPKTPKQPLRERVGKWYKKLVTLTKDIIARLIGIRSVSEVLLILLFSPVLIALGIPVALLALLVHFAIRPLLNLILRLVTGLKQSINNSIQKFIQRFSLFAFNRIVENETLDLIKKTRTMEDLDIWLVSYPNMPNIGKFKQPTVLVVPDIVYNEFPVPYARELPTIVQLEVNINKTILSASHVVTYSEHVKQEHLVHEGLRSPGTISVVPHAPMSSREILDADQSLEIIKTVSAKVIKDYLEITCAKTPSKELLYQKELPWGHFDYIFVSSQTRPHKNHLNLIKAYRIMLREKYKNAKLVFTGGFSEDMEEYINYHGLQHDVLSIPRIPAYEHAAFFAGAKLAVAPTLFEGGFPFLFSQAVSVGTPILMSDIPVVREVLGKDSIFTFKPYSIEAITDKLVWAWENYDDLLDHQMKLYEQMKDRTWDDVALDFSKIFSLLVHNE